MKKLSLVLAGLLIASQALAAVKCPTGTTAGTDQIDSKPICNLTGTYENSNLVLTPDIAWVLNGAVLIGSDKKNSSTLTLEAGTFVYGTPGSYITISRDSKIFAKGTQAKPVVMTAADRKAPVSGYWGGLVITGNARINICNPAPATGVCEGFIEGVPSDIAPKYGGTNDDDSSGSMEYMRVEYAGFTLSKDNELNAITFYGVGRGTKVDYIEAYKGADDGIELFGGTVNATHVVSIDSDDDGWDWDQGWSGAVQFMYIEHQNASEADPNGIEADNNRNAFTAEPRSNPTLANVTITSVGQNAKLLNGIMLRRGTAAHFYNIYVGGNWQNCINIDDAETFTNGGIDKGNYVEQTGLQMVNSIFQCANNMYKEDATDPWSIAKWFGANAELNNYVMPVDQAVLQNGVPVPGSAALKTGMTPPDQEYPGAFRFKQVDYIGAFAGGTAPTWMDGWTIR